MKKCIIYCFSGTGNTKRVAQSVLTELAAYDYEGEVFSITYNAYKQKQFPNPNEYDLIGIAYPGHAFNAPHLFNKFVKRLPKAERGQQAFIVKSSGEPFSVNNSSSGAAKRYLRKKGYNLTYEKHYLMPYNIMFRYPNGLAKQMYLYQEQMAKSSAKKIVEGKKELLRPNIGSLIMCFLGKIEWFGAWFNGLFYKVDTRKCIKCGKCAHNCPAQNITFKDGKYHFGNHCTLCCGCTLGCPTNAIKMGILNGLKVNGPYKFKNLTSNKEVSGNYVNDQTTGYYKKFNKYYNKIDEELKEMGLVPPRTLFEPDEYAIASKREKRKMKRNAKLMD